MLREAGKVKTVVGNTQFELNASANKSFRIRDIHIYNPVTQYATLSVDRATVGYYRVGGGVLGNHLPFAIQDEENVTLFRMLQDRGVMSPIPVASGETFRITGVHQAGSIVSVVYDEYDAGDVRNSEPNGSQSNRYQFINYGRFSGTLATGDNKYATGQSPSDFPRFPFGEIVPSKLRMKLIGICASDASKQVTATGKQHTTFLKMVRNRVTLFDDDRQGFPLYGQTTFVSGVTNVGTGRSVIGNYDDNDRRLPLFLPSPLDFGEGESLDLYVSTTVTTGSGVLAVTDAEVGLIFDVTAQP